MAVVKKVGGKFRVTDPKTGKITKNKSGTAVSKGSSSKAKVQKQATAINLSKLRAKGRKIPKPKK